MSTEENIKNQQKQRSGSMRLGADKTLIEQQQNVSKDNKKE